MPVNLDPWGPILSILIELNNSDFFESTILRTGAVTEFRALTDAESYSNVTRLRVRKAEVMAAYQALDDDQKGPFVQIVVQAIIGRANDGDELKDRINDALNDVGWEVIGNTIAANDAMLSEQYFPVGSEHDAYVAIRSIIKTAATKILIVDPYIGSNLLSTLGASLQENVLIELLTKQRNLPRDFVTELQTFRIQNSSLTVEVRYNTDFHDRFIWVDDKIFHVGASIKDAGKRAFMISRVEDAINSSALEASINTAWMNATPSGL